jgi:CHAT domain-containing protein/tetratricopeptide (TPR) repeat protein
LADIYQALEYFSEAEEQHKRALAIREQVLRPDNEDLGRSIGRLGLLYLAQGRMEDAEPLLARGLAIAQSRRGLYSKENEADSLNNLGLVYSATGRSEKADESFRRALQIDETIYGASHPEVATILTNWALSYKSSNGDAELLLKRALAIMEGAYGKDHLGTTFSLHNLAMLYRSEGRLDDAEDLLKRSLEIRRRSLELDNSDLALSRSSLGWLFVDRERWNEAYDLFMQSAESSIRRSRRERRSPRNTADLAERANIGQAMAVFVGQVAVGWKIAERVPLRNGSLQEETFLAAQWAHTSMTGSAVARMAARFGAKDPNLASVVRERQDLVVAWQLLDARFTSVRAHARDQQDSREADEIRTSLKNIDQKIETIDQRLGKEFPEFIALAYPEPLDISAVRELLGPEEALIQFLDLSKFSDIPEQTFAWVVTKNNDPQWLRIPIGTSALIEKVEMLRCGLDAEQWEGIEHPARCGRLLGIDSKPPLEVPLPFNLSVAHDLYRMLLAPFEELIRDKNLFIVPSGPLTSLPFHVLVTETPKTKLPKTFGEFKDVAWLVRRQPITILPSVASLQELRKLAKQSAAPKAYIGYGNPVLHGADDCRRGQIRSDCSVFNTASDARANSGAIHSRMEMRSASLERMFRNGIATEAVLAEVRALCPLPDTAQEIRCVAQSFGGTDSEVRLGEDATEAEIKRLSESGELAKYRVLHFATHGLLAGDTGFMEGREGEPALVMTPDPGNDGLLKASEVAQLKLNADWVILSACNTAAGDKLGAEALSGLARAFFYAGTRALLVSHWPVYSDVAVRLVNDIFSAMRANQAIGRAEALRHAMIRLIEDPTSDDNVHPSIWAPFIVVGEGRR